MLLGALGSSVLGVGQAIAVVSPTPAITGLTFSTIPAVTLTGAAPVPPATTTTIDWTITGPNGFSRDGSGTSPLALPAELPEADGPYTLSATDVGGTPPAIATFTIDRTPPAPPTVTSGPPSITGKSPFTFAWLAPTDATSAHWQLLDGITQIAEGTVPATQVVITPPALAAGDRILNFRVSLLDAVLNPSAFSSWHPFVVDQTAPGAPTDVTVPTGTIRTLTPAFSWLGTEVGGTFEWNITDADGKSIVSPGVLRTTAATSVTTPTLQLAPNVIHKLTFRVRQIDPYGNRGPENGRPFTITTKPLPGAKPRTRWAQYMRPVVGRGGVPLQPLLSWRRMNAGTSVFNVQIYRGNVKVLSRFPTRNRFLVPKGKLKPGVLYTWTVWSYIGKKKDYAPQPMTSYFTTRK